MYEVKDLDMINSRGFYRNNNINHDKVMMLANFAKYDMDKSIMQHYAYMIIKIRKSYIADTDFPDYERIHLHLLNNYIPRIISEFNKKNKSKIKTTLDEKVYLVSLLEMYISHNNIKPKFNKLINQGTINVSIVTKDKNLSHELDDFEDKISTLSDYKQTMIRILIEARIIDENEFLEMSDDKVSELTEEYYYLEEYEIDRKLKDAVTEQLSTIDSEYLAEFDDELENRVEDLCDKQEELQNSHAMMMNLYDRLQDEKSETKRQEIIKMINETGNNLGLDYDDIESRGAEDFDNSIAGESEYTIMEEAIGWQFGRCPIIIDAVFNDVQYESEDVINYFKENYDSYDANDYLKRIVNIDKLCNDIKENEKMGKYLGGSDWQKITTYDGCKYYIFETKYVN